MADGVPGGEGGAMYLMGSHVVATLNSCKFYSCMTDGQANGLGVPRGEPHESSERGHSLAVLCDCPTLCYAGGAIVFGTTTECCLWARCLESRRRKWECGAHSE